MDAAELRAMQAPIKERYKSDPSAAVITLKAKGSIDNEGIACKVETGRALAVAGLHPATGGSGLELCSGDMLLEALVACAGVTLKSVATAVDLPLKSGNVIAEVCRRSNSVAKVIFFKGFLQSHCNRLQIAPGEPAICGISLGQDQQVFLLLRKQIIIRAQETADIGHAVFFGRHGAAIAVTEHLLRDLLGGL